jgi:PST family polysaccharide transporter
MTQGGDERAVSAGRDGADAADGPGHGTGGGTGGAPEEPTDGGGAAPTPSVGTTASRGFLWANVGVLTRYVSALVLAAALARVLDPTEYAVMVTVMIVTFYFDNALDLGMGAALVYEQEQGVTRRVQVAFTTTIGITAVLATTALVGAPLIGRYFGLEGYTTLFRCLAVVVVFSGCTAIPWSLFMRAMDFRSRAIVEASRDLTRFVLTLGLAFGGLGAWAVMIGLIASYFVWMAMTWLFMHFRPTLEWDRGIAGELFAYAWRMAGTRFLGVLSLNGDYLVVGNRNRDEYPLYYQAFRLPEFVMGAQLNAMSAVLFPMYSRIRSEGKMAMRDALYRALRLVALFSIPVGCGLALVGRDAVGVMYGANNPTTIATMQVLSLTGCVVGLGFATGDLLFALGRVGIMVRLNLVMVPVLLTSMWFVAPHGIVWVAVVHLVVAVVFTAARQVIVNRLVEAEPSKVLASLVPGVVVAACIVAAALPVRLLTGPGFGSMVLIVLAGGVGGLASLWISPGARRELLDLVAKVRG